MAAKKPATRVAQKNMKRKASKVFSEEEKNAMKDRAQEVKGARGKEVDTKAEVLAKIATLSPSDRTVGKRLFELITATAPDLSPKLWYGMPAYYRNGKLICHFQPADKFKTRYPTLGFSDAANLDDGALWPVAYAIKGLSAAEEARIAALVKKALS